MIKLDLRQRFEPAPGPVPVNQVPVVFGSGRPFFATGAPVELLLLENPTTIVPGDRVLFASPASQNSSSAAATASGIRCTIARVRKAGTGSRTAVWVGRHAPVARHRDAGIKLGASALPRERLP
jgi:hypothetical protein